MKLLNSYILLQEWIYLCKEEVVEFLTGLIWSEMGAVCSTLKAEVEEPSWIHTLRNCQKPQEGLDCHEYGSEAQIMCI